MPKFDRDTAPGRPNTPCPQSEDGEHQYGTNGMRLEGNPPFVGKVCFRCGETHFDRPGNGPNN